VNRLLQFFEQFIQPFPPEEPLQPPKGLLAFCRHYTRGAEAYLLVMAVLTGMIAVLEVTLFDFLGQLVDWLSTKDRATFLQEESGTLWWMAFIVLIAIPVTVFLHSVVIHVTVYFIGMLVLVASSDLRLSIPLLVWLIAYGLTLYYFIPRLRLISAKQADARSMMTGRIVDSYTNISTVKLFSHTDRESEYAQDSMQGFLNTVYPQMQLVTKLQCAVWTLNSLLIFSIGALSIYLWLEDSISIGAIAIAVGLNLRLNGMSQWIMWEMSMLFENIGTVQDGINMLAQPREVQDQPAAKPLQVNHGEIDFKAVNFDYATKNLARCHWSGHARYLFATPFSAR